MSTSDGLAVVNGAVLTPLETITDGVVLVSGGKVVRVGARSKVEVPAGSRLVDAEGGFVVPGFIDLHVHGGAGCDAMDGTWGAIAAMAQFHARHGTTSMLPTTVSFSRQGLLGVLTGVSAAVGASDRGANVLGIHLEGPYISGEQKGAHSPDQIRPPSVKEFLELLVASQRTVRMITFAPELQGAWDLVGECVRNKVVPSVGHTNATYAQTMATFKIGVKHASHVFNSMRGLQQREPGVVGAVLASSQVTAQLIADGIHVHPAVMRMIVILKGANRIALITDAISATGSEKPTSKLGSMSVTVKDGVPRLDSGVIAGSILTMDEAVRNMVQKVNVPLHEAVRMATLTPAQSIGIDGAKGSLEPGKDADLLVLTRDLNVRTVVIAGNVAYQRQPPPPAQPAV